MPQYKALLFCFFILPVGSFNPFKKIVDFFRTPCDSRDTFNQTDLKRDLENKLFGQHLASKVILKAVTGFMRDPNPTKPLVLSLHGPSGTGKNLVSKIIAQNLFQGGDSSSQVHLFIATHHFPHRELVETYKVQLQQWIRGNVSKCPLSMFIFDEMEKMNPVLSDTIKCHLDHYTHIDGVSFRHAIFLFLSNEGATIINQIVYDYWKEGKQREEIQLNSHGLEIAINRAIFNNKDGGFWRSSLIDSNVVDFFVPFLPLEYKHVLMCIRAEMEAQNLRYDPGVAENMASEMRYFPEKEEIFSVNGCKGVKQRLKFYI
ncbi:hypothetical protein MATL_G00221010 [Megalops atlanticus]|uniref:Torsin n=1 Tax=Megalops atlanticus TaxID=7932 RepID=A0A9D3PG62_MEGAT|nr:hypothetical protein MATL_G00221010 [Megalops atlanticus]